MGVLKKEKKNGVWRGPDEVTIKNAESQNNLRWMRKIEIADELLYYCFQCQIAFFHKNANAWIFNAFKLSN